MSIDLLHSYTRKERHSDVRRSVLSRRQWSRDEILDPVKKRVDFHMSSKQTSGSEKASGEPKSENP